MQGASRTTSEAQIEGLIERLSDPGQTPAGELAAAASAALGQAAELEQAVSPWAHRLDAAVVRAVLRGTAPDAALAALPVDAVAALVDRAVARLAGGDAAEGSPERQLVFDLLDLVRRTAFVRRIERRDVSAWAGRMLAAIDASHFSVGRLLRQRAETYASRVLFHIPGGSGTRTLSWRQTLAQTELLARGLLSLDPDPAPVAILAENRIETALVDLACLTHGLVDVMVPANATDEHVAFILGHAKVRTLVVSGAGQLRKIAAQRDALPELRHTVVFDPAGCEGAGVLTLDELLRRAERVDPAEAAARSERVRVDDLATVMYTSGTTGAPKGIRFSQRNLVFKRFARGLALPEIGDSDVLLCFLPLFHTFGRFLEMLGSVYWGATYCFLDNPAVDALIRGMRRFRPTVFISVPKKWMQLHEAIVQRADPLQATDEELLEATRQVTGGRLRWGLSAAGHLDSDIFRFFQRQGVELLSGFGMTEATGGITMTPPGGYRENSLGLALPGIELRLDGDGELCVRGPYVMQGYLEPPGGEPSFDDEGWLHTGDLMQRDADGHYRLVDRKKEIYKNVKGETIAPQRIESLFRDFDSVARAFLVGDHREYNTLLIYPNFDYRELDLRALGPQDLKAHFRSLVVSVNQFLAPFERIVDFAVIDRDLDPARGELTEKGTPRRRQVVDSFRDVIRLLYRRASLQVGGLELTLPNWLLQAVGLTVQDIVVERDRIVLPGGTSLGVQALEPGLARVGSCHYRHPPGPLNLGALLRSPRLWLGNEELESFAVIDPPQRQRPGRTEEGVEWVGRARPYAARPGDVERIEQARTHGRRELGDLHLAASLIAADDALDALAAIRLLETLVADKDHALASPARLVLARGAHAVEALVARRAFAALVPAARAERFTELVQLFLERWPDLLDERTRAELSKKFLPPAKVDAFVELARQACLTGDADRAVPLLRFVAAYGACHPASFRRLRAFLGRMSVFAADAALREHAESCAASLRGGFREWLGAAADMAVDPETEQEYHWDDVVVFDEQVPDEDRMRILAAIRDTPMIRESSFLFSNGVMIRLDDIPPGGVWIRPLGARHGKAVYRMTIQTRFHGGLDLALNLNRTLTADKVAEEIRWLLLAAGAGGREPLVEDFGGYWPEQDLWTEEFISGETLDRALRRLAKRPSDEEDLRQLWPFLAWTGLSAYVDFWHRTGERWEIADPDPCNVIVPTDDFQTGVRIISVSARRPHRGLRELMRGLMDEFIRPTVEQYPDLAGLVGWDIVFSSVLEILGEGPGLERLETVLGDDAGSDAGAEMLRALGAYTDRVRVRGFLPRRMHFAAERYRRWSELSADATPPARARTLQELYETYGLQRVTGDYPEARLRFFRETVFRDASPALLAGLDGLVARMRSRELAADQLIDAVAELRGTLEIPEDHAYFLARVSLPYLRPEDAADFVSSDLGGRPQSEIVVTLEDQDGRPFRVRHALNPKEVGRLLRLFQAARLDVRFRPEHRYLVALNDRQQILGGIFYDVAEDGSSAHLEKIVVAETHRRKGVADGLMNEFLNRLRSAGVKAVTTGFFRPGYFYNYGFRIEKRYAGLVKSLE